MSPYAVAMTDVVDRFATSIERVAILRGLISYRQAARALNLADGYMWLDGSFVEDVESVRGRPPKDIDIVTFMSVPGSDAAEKMAFMHAHADIFFAEEAKKKYMCDAYVIDLTAKPLALVDNTRYWFGLFSHQRVTSLWKGMLRVPMQTDDVAAERLLDSKEQGLIGAQNA